MKTTAQIEREVQEHLQETRALEAAGRVGGLTSHNTGTTYTRLSADRTARSVHRWVGKCKRCSTAHAVDGRLFMAHGDGRHDHVIRASDGDLLTTSATGTDPTTVWVACGDHHCMLRRVHEGTKHSKHECGARCTQATGPSCDCRCKGRNHGSGI